MESRLIYESDKTYQNRIQWTKLYPDSESEWHYLDLQTLDENRIRDILNKSFNSEILYLVIDRNDSTEMDKLSVVSKIKNLYGKTDFKIWDKNFKNIIEFRNEVYRQGINASR